MGFRFRKSFRLAPGVRLNFSGSGASMSVGPRGLSATFGQRGTFLNTGIPGTGLYSRERIGGSSAAESAPTRPGRITKSATVTVSEDGTISFLDENGQPLSHEWVERAKKQKGDLIRNQIQKMCDDINGTVEALGKLHLHTPAPDQRIKYVRAEFKETEPNAPAAKPHGLLGWLFESVRKRIDAENAEALSVYQQVRAKWHSRKLEFAEGETAREQLLEKRVFSEIDAMEGVLEGALKGIEWPRETNVSAEVDSGGLLVLLDVDLPEIEDMPKTTASVPSRGYKLTVKEMSATKIQKLYMAHVHAIGFRIIGEAFAVLPKSQEVVLSAFSQRPNKATGVVDDEYLYSVRVMRADWMKIDFANLAGLDVVAALERFELQREMTKTGIFRQVIPMAGPAQ